MTAMLEEVITVIKVKGLFLTALCFVEQNRGKKV